MSYIDTIDHEFVGLFGHLPVYHPLETLIGDPANPAYFSCDPTHLVLGGGSGEHPALVLRRPDYAVGWYIEHLLDGLRTHNPTDATISSTLTEQWQPFLDASLTANIGDVLHFAGWNVQRHHAFYEMCSSSALHTPYNEKQDGWFEGWLAATLGECIIFAMPELIPNLDSVLPEIQTLLRPPLAFRLNILLPPPGYPLPYGRKRVSDHVRWGYSRWWSR